VRPAASAALLAGLAIAALLAERLLSVGVIAAVLLAACLRAPGKRRRVYLAGVLVSSAMVVVLSPFLQATGSHPLWNGPIVPVLGSLDVTTEELRIAGLNGLRLASVGLAFTCFALLLDHDQLVASAGWARRSALAVGLATRLVPTLERDGAGLVESLRGRGLVVEGPRAYAALLSPLLASSLERGLNLAEAMEARGFGRPGRTRVPGRTWAAVDVMAVSTAIAVVVLGAWWL
jgi:energy-coupling factor transport system permease protein